MLSHADVPTDGRTASGDPLNGPRYQLPTAIGSRPRWTRGEIWGFRASPSSLEALFFRHRGRIDRPYGECQVKGTNYSRTSIGRVRKIHIQPFASRPIAQCCMPLCSEDDCTMIEFVARSIGRLIIPRKWRPAVARFWERVWLTRRSPRNRRFGKASATVLDCCIAYNAFGGYCVPLAAFRSAPAQAVFNGELWEPDTIAFIRKRCGAGDVVHAGAFFGDGLPAISTALVPGATLWAFEPNPEPFRCALVTKTINRLDNVQSFEAALSDKQSVADLTFAKGGDREFSAEAWIDGAVGESASSSSVPVWRVGLRTVVPIRTTTIDAIVPPDRKVTIIHLDLEGHEPQAIAGAMETIRRCRPIMIVEVRYTEGDAWLIDALSPLGYRETVRFGRNVVLEIPA